MDNTGLAIEFILTTSQYDYLARDPNSGTEVAVFPPDDNLFEKYTYIDLRQIAKVPPEPLFEKYKNGVVEYCGQINSEMRKLLCEKIRASKTLTKNRKERFIAIFAA